MFLAPIIVGFIELHMQRIPLGIICAIPSLWLWKEAIMSTFGHIEIHLDYEEATIFSGVGNIGRKHHFRYVDVKSIDFDNWGSQNNTPMLAIKIEAHRNIWVGKYMKYDAQKFIIETLKEFIKDDHHLRSNLAPNLSNHLID